MTTDILFFNFTSLVILCFLFVLYNYNPIFSIFFLVLGFLNVSGLFFLLNSEFIALIFILIYVGAIAVLFLFIIMMIDIKRHSIEKKNTIFHFAGFFLSSFFFFSIIYTILDESVYLIKNDFVVYHNWLQSANQLTILESLGYIIYDYYAYYFLLVGIILLLAMIGAIILTIRNVHFIKQQCSFEQSSRIYRHSYFLIDY